MCLLKKREHEDEVVVVMREEERREGKGRRGRLYSQRNRNRRRL
jgi:hypothetical protein